MDSLQFLFVILTVFKQSLSSENCTDALVPICNRETHCQHCLKAHHCCVWCFQDNYEGYRCSTAKSPNFNCDQLYIVNNTKSEVSDTIKNEFSDAVVIQDEKINAIQFSPQIININLRTGEPLNITFKYRPAKDYPLDLYYLMDLTYSMKPDLDALTMLGVNLTRKLGEMTKNYRIAFGSYIDKPEMPFYETGPGYYENPCSIDSIGSCEKGYLFKHKLNFTNEIDQFIKEVNNSQVSANLDNLEGGIDALMQLLLCDKGRINWFDKSRKLVMIATEGIMHFAGDGLLSGSVKRNTGQCMIDTDGNYIKPILHDYPSLEEIYHKLKEKKVNIIIATRTSSSDKIQSFDFYEQMHQVIHDVSFIRKLENGSSNILKSVEEGYYDFIKKTHFFINTTNIPGLKVDFFADCHHDGRWNKTDRCYNTQVGQAIEYKVQLLLNEYTDLTSETLYIEEEDIHEKIEINVNFGGSICNCPISTNQKSCEHGVSDCGNCTCEDGWTGEFCDIQCEQDLRKCRYSNEGQLTISCSGRGDCVCSKCKCHHPYGGEFCEYSCPFEKYTRLICGGHGVCIDGECQCDPMYGGKDCTCSLLQDSCKIPGITTLCVNNGTCQCNKCECKDGYWGPFCELCSECHGLCSNFEEYVTNYMANTTVPDFEETQIQIQTVTELNEEWQKCVVTYYDDKKETYCRVYYSYDIDSNMATIKIAETDCSKPLGAGMLGIIIITAIIGLGILAIIIIKGRNMYRDKIEYEEFMKDRERAFHTEQNPLYKSPLVTYNNPNLPTESFEMKDM